MAWWRSDQAVAMLPQRTSGTGSLMPLAARSVASASSTHRRDLPGLESGLARLGVHRHDSPRLISDKVDNGIGHLTLAPISVQLPKDDHFLTLGELAEPATAG